MEAGKQRPGQSAGPEPFCVRAEQSVDIHRPDRALSDVRGIRAILPKGTTTAGRRGSSTS